MTEPNIKVAKILFRVMIALAIIGPFTLYMTHKALSARCSKNIAMPPEKKKKKSNTLRNIIIVSILAGLTAQAMNYSYSFMRFKPTTA